MSKTGGRIRSISICVVAVAGYLSSSHVALSDTLEGALVQAYQNNPSLNAQRAALRATDEGVGIALSGYRPRVSATVSQGATGTDIGSRAAATGLRSSDYSNLQPQTYGVTATQTLFNGFQTGNRTRQAEAQVFSARETLRTQEQTVMLNGATAYMNCLLYTSPSPRD